MRIIKKIFIRNQKIEAIEGGGVIEAENTGKYNGFPVRMAARAIVYNANGDIALNRIQAGKQNKIPGGGIDVGEGVIAALRREILEEAGAQVEILSELGAIVQYGEDTKPFQVSFVYICRVVGELMPRMLTEKEIKDQFELVWVSLNEACRLLRSEVHTDNPGRELVRARELALIKEVL